MDGMALVEIAARLGVGDEAVRAAVVAGGGTIRPRARRPSGSMEGLTLAQASQRLGISDESGAPVVAAGGTTDLLGGARS